MLVRMVLRLLDFPSQQPITRRTAITKRELVAIVVAAATAFIFMPEPFSHVRNVGVVCFLGWLAAILWDVLQRAPDWLWDIVCQACAGNGTPDDNSNSILGRAMTTAAEQLREAALWISVIVASVYQGIHAALLKALQRALKLSKFPRGSYHLSSAPRHLHRGQWLDSNLTAE